jgi:Zn-dependent alcohol dehydrogenase
MVTTEAIVAREPAQLHGVNWSIEKVDVFPPGDGEILVEIRATGICHTDLLLSSLPSGELGITYPKVVGHEGTLVQALNGFQTQSHEDA